MNGNYMMLVPEIRKKRGSVGTDFSWTRSRGKDVRLRLALETRAC